MRTVFLRMLAAFCVLSLFAAACGDDSGDDDAAPDETTATDDDSSDPSTTEPADGDEPVSGECTETVAGTQINYGVFAPSNVLDPTRVSGALVGGTEVAALYDVLFIFDQDTGDYVPHLAESIESNDDYTEWTLKLREGITFSDGTALDAQLVADHLVRFFDEGVRNTSAGFMTPISETTVVDATTLVFTLSTAWVEFPFIFADEPGMVVNVNVVGDDVDAFGAAPPDAAGVGPYVVERNAPGEELVLVARDDYWGGPVCVERLRFVFNPGTTYDAFQSGDLNVGFLRSPGEIAQARENGDGEFFVPQDGGSVFLVNHAEGRPGADERVRQAISLAIDVSVINDRAYQGQLIAAKSLIAPGSRFYSDAIIEADTDATLAAELLAEAKADGYDGALEVLCTTTPPSDEVALTIEGLLEAVGFDVTVEILGQGDQIGEIVAANFDTGCWGYNAGPATANTGLTRNLRSDSQSNRTGYASDEMDAALDAILGAEDSKAAFAEVNRIFVEDTASVALGGVEEGIVYAPEVSGIISTAATMYLFHDAVIG